MTSDCPDNSFTSHFPKAALAQTGPATLHQWDWASDAVFVQALRQSWCAQYADYLGRKEANRLIEQLSASGDLYAHPLAATLVACQDNKPVGIAALRPLQGLSLITMLEILPDHRRLGIGRQLVQALSVSGERLLVHVSIHRPELCVFYNTLGFKLLKRSAVDHYGHALEFDIMVR